MSRCKSVFSHPPYYPENVSSRYRKFWISHTSAIIRTKYTCVFRELRCHGRNVWPFKYETIYMLVLTTNNLYAFFWVITRRLEFIYRRFGSLCLFHLHRRVGVSRMNLSPYHFLFLVHSTHIYLPMKMEQTECSETSAYKLQTPGNYPKKAYNIQNTAKTCNQE